MPCRFVQIPIELIDYVKAKKLSGLQYSLWLFLYSLDPFGDRFVPIPSPEQIAIELNVCARSIQRAAQRLADLDLFDFNVNTWCAKNTTSNKNNTRTKRSECGQNDPYVASPTKRSPLGQKAPIDSPNPATSKQSTAFQTYTNKLDLSYKSETTSKQINNQEPDLEIDFWLEDNVDSSTSLPNQDLKEGSNSACVELKLEANENQAPRPWLIEGKLDPKFVEWLAQKWSIKYGDNLYTARANVLRHFKKDEQNIIIAWSEYSAEYLDRYRNTQTRIATGLEIAESEQKRLIDNVGALTRPLPEELSLLAEQKTAPERILTQAQPKPRQEIKNEILTGEDNDRFAGNKPNIDWHQLPADEEKPENFEAYRQWQPEKIDKPATLRQIQEFLKSFGKK